MFWEATYKPFGEGSVNPNSSITNNLRFPGQYYDAETGFHYNYFRYYDPGTGRYLRADPIGLAGGINLFAYSLNNPINNIDKEGLEVLKFGLTGEVSGWLATAIKWIAEKSGVDVDQCVTFTGISIAGAISFPGLSGGEWDFGFSVTPRLNVVNIEGSYLKNILNKGIGLYKGTIDVGVHVDSVKTMLGNNSVDVSGFLAKYGGAVTFNDNNITGVNFSYGGGGLINITATPTPIVWSHKHGLLTSP